MSHKNRNVSETEKGLKTINKQTYRQRKVPKTNKQTNKKHFPEGEFQRNLAQSSRSSIERQN